MIIEGLRYRLSGVELRAQYERYAAWWTEQADRVGVILESQGGELSDEVLERTKRRRQSTYTRAAVWRNRATLIKPDDEYLLSDKDIEEICWPSPIGLSDEEFRESLLTPPQRNPLEQLLASMGADK